MEAQPYILSEPPPYWLLSVLPNSFKDSVLSSSLALGGTLSLCCSISGDSDYSYGLDLLRTKAGHILNSRQVYTN